MSFLQINFFSHVLDSEAEINVILPQKEQGIGLNGADVGNNFPVLWLLHGNSDDHTIWMRRTSIERYASSFGLAVVMPAVSYSRYNNMLYGPRYYDYVTQELPEFCSKLFPKMSRRREDNFIAGLSMGGGGAMQIGLKNPENYSYICMLSTGGVAPLEGLWRKSPVDRSEYDTSPQFSRMRDIYGVGCTDDLKGTDYDILKLIRDTAVSGKPLPHVYHAMGTDDIRYPVGQEIKKTFESIPENPYHYEYHEGPGAHEWSFWDKWIVDFLKVLPISRKEEE